MLLVLLPVNKQSNNGRDRIRAAIEFTDDSEMAVRALVKLLQIRELPAAPDDFTELFMKTGDAEEQK